MAVQPRLAAAVVVLRASAVTERPEVFMVRRVAQSEFMPDVYVFPGGSVSPEDRLAEGTPGLCVPSSSPIADPEGRTLAGSGTRAAAIRELFEEANILLAYHNDALVAIDETTSARFADHRRAFNERRGSLIGLVHTEHLVLATDQLAYFAHWITPESLPKRFDTHFFLARAPIAQQAVHDDLETSDGLWIQPSVALARFARGEFPVAFPTYHQLRDLAAFASVQEAFVAVAERYVPTHAPVMCQKDGKMYICLPGEPDTDWPA